MRDPATGKRRYYLYYIANRDDDRMSKGRGIPKAKATDWWDRIITRELHALERPFILLDPQGIPSHLSTAACVRNPFGSRDNLPFNLCQPLTTTSP
jgi:hypothetical protein